jgi:hypothetical protein
MLQNWLMPQLNEYIRENFIFQHNQVLPHYHNAVTRFLNVVITTYWIGHEAPKVWPTRSPDVTPKDSFFWECIIKFRMEFVSLPYQTINTATIKIALKRFLLIQKVKTVW